MKLHTGHMYYPLLARRRGMRVTWQTMGLCTPTPGDVTLTPVCKISVLPGNLLPATCAKRLRPLLAASLWQGSPPFGLARALWHLSTLLVERLLIHVPLLPTSPIVYLQTKLKQSDVQRYPPYPKLSYLTLLPTVLMHLALLPRGPALLRCKPYILLHPRVALKPT